MDRGRVMIVLTFLLLPLGGLEARLFQLQIVNGPEATTDVNNRRQSVEIIPPQRGRIVDRANRVLAEDRPCFDCYLVLEEYEKAPGPLAAALNMPADDFRQAVEAIYEKIEKQVQARPANERARLYRRERRVPYLLKRNIGDAAVPIEIAPGRYPGAVIRESLMRVYPYNQTGCHLVG